jgi:DNA-directed RNA polymerase specialized sigma subunit
LGAIKRDINGNERNISTKYASLDSPGGLRILLGDYHALKNRRFQGDVDASIILLDLATAIELAGLTNRQRQALELTFNQDLTQAEAGKRLGLAQNTVSEAVDRAVENIAEVYWYWSQHGEGYCVGNEMEAE